MLPMNEYVIEFKQNFSFKEIPIFSHNKHQMT